MKSDTTQVHNRLSTKARRNPSSPVMSQALDGTVDEVQSDGEEVGLKRKKLGDNTQPRNVRLVSKRKLDSQRVAMERGSKYSKFAHQKTPRQSSVAFARKRVSNAAGKHAKVSARWTPSKLLLLEPHTSSVSTATELKSMSDRMLNGNSSGELTLCSLYIVSADRLPRCSTEMLRLSPPHGSTVCWTPACMVNTVQVDCCHCVFCRSVVLLSSTVMK